MAERPCRNGAPAGPDRPGNGAPPESLGAGAAVPGTITRSAAPAEAAAPRPTEMADDARGGPARYERRRTRGRCPPERRGRRRPRVSLTAMPVRLDEAPLPPGFLLQVSHEQGKSTVSLSISPYIPGHGSTHAPRSGRPRAPRPVSGRRPHRREAGRQDDTRPRSGRPRRTARHPVRSGGSDRRSTARRPRARARIPPGTGRHRRGSTAPGDLSTPAGARGPARQRGSLPGARRRRTRSAPPVVRNPCGTDRVPRAPAVPGRRDRRRFPLAPLVPRRLSGLVPRPGRRSELPMANRVPPHVSGARPAPARGRDGGGHDAPFLDHGRAPPRQPLERRGDRPRARRDRPDRQRLPRFARRRAGRAPACRPGSRT